jgi:signal transduction histidine kinase
MKRIVNDVLDFARPIHLELKEMNAGYVIKKACELCIGKAEERGVTIVIDIPDLPVKINLDSVHMQRALVNLIGNAIEASGSGQNVSVSADIKEDSLSIVIRDDGTGMDEETRGNLFMPFFTKKSAGTGLGMPIAKKIIEGHDGTIDIKSHPGDGTQVIVSLPTPLK